MSTPLLTPDEQVSHLQRAVEQGSHDIESVAILLPKVIESGAWTSFATPTGTRFEHDSFQSFVTKPRYNGLGIKSREELVNMLAPHDPATAELAEKAWRGEIPAARKLGDNQHSPLGGGATVPKRDRGQADSILARLKRDDPALAQQVIEGDVSPNQAALSKGWRKPRVLLTSPEHVASKIYDHWTGDQISELIELLQEGA